MFWLRKTLRSLAPIFLAPLCSLLVVWLAPNYDWSNRASGLILLGPLVVAVLWIASGRERLLRTLLRIVLTLVVYVAWILAAVTNVPVNIWVMRSAMALLPGLYMLLALDWLACKVRETAFDEVTAR